MIAMRNYSGMTDRDLHSSSRWRLWPFFLCSCSPLAANGLLTTRPARRKPASSPAGGLFSAGPGR